MLNLINQKFGRLLVLSKSSNKIDNKKRGYWECVCECGNRSIVNTTKLTSGHTKSCGCIQRPNLIGLKFNNLTVVSKIELDKRSKRNKGNEWNCLCDCGKTRIVETNRLTDDAIKSCGCTNMINTQESGSKSHKWLGCGDISGSLYCSIKNGAKDRDLDFNISIEEIWDLFLKQNKKCILSGVNISFHKENDYKRTASLDRINSLKGYTIDNIQWVHRDVNKMKMDLNESRFIEMCKLITATQQIEKY